MVKELHPQLEQEAQRPGATALGAVEKQLNPWKGQQRTPPYTTDWRQLRTIGG